MTKKRIMSGMASIILAMAVMYTPASAAAANFSDVSSDHWAATSITAMANAGIMNGIGDNLFAPSQTISYAELVTMVVRQFYPDQVSSGTGSTAWYSPFMDFAEAEGLLAGTSIASATSIISRYEMSQLLYNVAKATGADVNVGQVNGVADAASIPYNYTTAVSYCYGSGLITGTDSIGTFNGNGSMDRAQAAIVMDRLVTLLTTTATPEVEAPAGAAYITGDNIYKMVGTNGAYDEDGSFYKYYTEWKGDHFLLTSAGMDDTGAELNFYAPDKAHTQITFTVHNPSDYVHSIIVSGTCQGDSNKVAPGETKTFTYTLEDGKTVIGGCHYILITGNGLRTADIQVSDIYFH